MSQEKRTKTLYVRDSNKGFPIFHTKSPGKDQYGRNVIRAVVTRFGQPKNAIKVFTNETSGNITAVISVVQIGDYIVEFTKMCTDRGVLISPQYHKIADINHDGKGSSILTLETIIPENINFKPENIERLEFLARESFEEGIPKIFNIKEKREVNA